MKVRKENFVIDSKKCIGYITDTAKYLLIQPVDEHDIKVLDNEVEEILKNTDELFSLIAFKIEDWNNELSPWEAPPAFGNKSFGSGAKDTLEFIESKLIPTVKEKYNLGVEIKFILGGYSLAGLFSLWSAYKSNTFSGIAAASPSVWFNGWGEFMNNNTPLSNTIYLSLGDSEEKTKNKVMSAVGDNIRKQEELLKNDNMNTILEWNKGGHFSNSDIRVAKAFTWCIENV
ncbi:alpha/beta hydrolase-fold protein [Gemella haemolysans]|uniref:Alpha/beta hydrolase-fold protein n=1 Tax=Gemella haemolysans TaxID=1379 RepID=A0AAW6B5R8_9BACL|nr:alpha/beta hydrolase-fold protein [Gemella haemolysans]MDB6185540.1 alpha/beta hydrolase-fold protein [Gemella haemolysans]MDU4714533.1 alpha/beta hydrolase-fold protein [Gemella haemolysans]